MSRLGPAAEQVLAVGVKRALAVLDANGTPEDAARALTVAADAAALLEAERETLTG